MENANNLSKNFDASVKKSSPPLPHWLGVRHHFERFSTRGQGTTVQNERRRNKEKRNQNEEGPEEMAYFCFNRWILLLFYPVSSAFNIKACFRLLLYLQESDLLPTAISVE
jgi:hypothetical protein